MLGFGEIYTYYIGDRSKKILLLRNLFKNLGVADIRLGFSNLSRARLSFSFFLLEILKLVIWILLIVGFFITGFCLLLIK